MDLKWLIEQLKKQYDLKNKIIGPEEHQEKCASYLGRVDSFTSAGVMTGCNEKYVEPLLKETCLEPCKSSLTPIINENGILDHLSDEHRVSWTKKQLDLTEEQWHDLCILAQA